jgi:hypothetical protein
VQVRHVVDGLDRKTEAIRLVANGKLQRCVDVALLGVSVLISFCKVNFNRDFPLTREHAGLGNQVACESSGESSRGSCGS